MDGSRRIKVLSECRSLLKPMHLANELKIQVGRFEIPSALIHTILSIPLGYFILIAAKTLYDVRFNITEEANTFFFALGCLQIQIIYFCLTRNNELIIQTINRIEDVVNRSNFICVVRQT